MTPSFKHILKTGFKLTVSAGLLGISCLMVQFDTMRESLRHADLGLLAVSALILLLGGFAGAASWFCILRLRLPAISYREVVARHWCGMFLNSFFPSNMGGDVVKGYLMARDSGQTGFVITSLFVDRVLNLIVLLCIGGLALLLQFNHPWLAVELLLSLLAVLSVVLFSTRLLRAKCQHWPRVGRYGMVVNLLKPVCELTATPRLLFPMLMAALLSQALKIWQNAFVIRALGLAMPIFCVWFVIPLFGLVSALPLSIGGLGLREMVALWLAGPLQLDATHLITFSLAGHVMVVLVNMLGIITFMSKNYRHASSRA